MPQANYIIKRRANSGLVILDVGPHDKYMTVTNAAEEVVEELVQSGELKEGQRLFYYDSEGSLDELLIKDGKFDGFKPGQLPEDMR